MASTTEILKRAKAAKSKMASVSKEALDRALSAMADSLLLSKKEILAENEFDILGAKDTLSPVMIDRLRLSEERIDGMAQGIRALISLPSPLQKSLSKTVRPNGLIIEKIAVPVGVIAIIYESRPNVTSDAAALAIKSGNTVILRGGKEAYKSSFAIVRALRRGLVSAGLPEDAIQLISDTTRDSAYELMRARGYVDLLIPRGGRGLIDACVENATVPTIETGTGICHIYVDSEANLDLALNVIENAKTQRPSVCNACEVCLVNRAVAKEFLPRLKDRLSVKRRENPVELICDAEAFSIIGGTPADKDSFDTEFLDYKLAVGIVGSTEEAINHINAHSTSHSEAIITENKESAARFTAEVDSAAVYVNASTRFTDGGVFGLGCEMGISTQKLHARGPMGIEELCTYKYVISGTGQTR